MIRKTEQPIMPIEENDNNLNNYDPFPSFGIGESKIAMGYQELAEVMIEHRTVIIDGYGGVLWDKFKSGLADVFDKKCINVSWHSSQDFFKTEEEIEELIRPFLGGDDPIFGRRFGGSFIDFFDQDKLEHFCLPDEADIRVIFGPGASLLQREGYLIYVDLPKNEIQYRSRAGSITNLASSNPERPDIMYKRFYFVDWIVLNRRKKELLNDMDLFIDGQHPDTPIFISGDNFRDGLDQMSKNYFRVRPWFESGSWGGQWMKNNFKQLVDDVKNYAWSFELIVPENGVVFESSNILLEFSFDFLMYYNPEAMMGKSGFSRFGYEWPLRIDYLDTIQGGNLSIQCHPKPEYIKKEFGETIPQDETYYIMQCEENSRVYLGFQDKVDPDELKEELIKSRDSLSDGKDDYEVNIGKYVQTINSEKHDLFLIPNGTIHGSGSGNLVLEISSTPYIFTFKLYDWLRKSSDKPRPINIERGFSNLDFQKKGQKVKEELIASPVVIEEGEDWKKIHLPTHSEHFYDIHRYDFRGQIEENTDGSCHVLIVAEGNSVVLETGNGRRQSFNYGETFVVPAAASNYKLINENDEGVKVLKVFLK